MGKALEGLLELVSINKVDIRELCRNRLHFVRASGPEYYKMISYIERCMDEGNFTKRHAERKWKTPEQRADVREVRFKEIKW